MSTTIRCLAMVTLFGMAVLLLAQDTASTTKNETAAPAKTGSYYVMDPVSGAYRFYQSNNTALPTLRSTEDVPGFGSYTNRFGEQWFQICSTTGLSADGKTLFIQMWLEKEISATQFDPATGVPTQPRKLAIQEVIREISTERSKIQFFTGEGKPLTKDEAGKRLKELKTVVLITGAKPAPLVFSNFNKNAVIAVMELQQMVVAQ